MKTTTRKESKFENQVRFNWGYHDAVQAVREGWATAERNFGFAKSAGWVIEKPEDVLRVHCDKTYATGWISGYERAVAGTNEPTSDEAWNDAVYNGLVS